MTCPFLKEARVKYCRAVSHRKLIPMTLNGRVEGEVLFRRLRVLPGIPRAGSGRRDRCGVSLPVRVADAVLRRRAGGQVCAVQRIAAVACGNDGYRYCELYLSLAHPEETSNEVDGVAMPDWLGYSANHMWIDVTEDGMCHAGIDAFLSRALGKIDRIAYVWQKGVHRPTAVLTAGGTDFEVVFPNEMLLSDRNLYLRADPAHLTANPYGSWLFEGRVNRARSRGCGAGPRLANGWNTS